MDSPSSSQSNRDKEDITPLDTSEPITAVVDVVGAMHLCSAP